MPEFFYIPAVTFNRLGSGTIRAQIEVGWAAEFQARDTLVEQIFVLIEDGDGHHRIDLGQIDISVPTAGRGQLRIKGAPKHSLQVLSFGRGPAGIKAHDFRRRREYRADPASLQPILLRTRGKSLEVAPRVEDGDCAPGIGLVAREIPQQRLAVGRGGVVAGNVRILAFGIDVGPPVRTHFGIARRLDLLELSFPRLRSGLNPRLDKIEFGLRVERPRMDKIVGASRRGSQTQRQP